MSLISEHKVIIIAIVVLFLLFFVAIISSILRNKRIRQSVTNGEFISYNDFEKNWITNKQGNKGTAGYKYNDGSGCYVILIFNAPVTDSNYENFENIYIGQSVNVCKRVHSHFTGKGNGDVYADIKNGKHVYVRFVMCEKEEMNEKEKELIRAFNATNYYNKTNGGATKR